MQFVQMVVSVSVVLLKDLWWVGWIAGFGSVGVILGVRSLASARSGGGGGGGGAGGSSAAVSRSSSLSVSNKGGRADSPAAAAAAAAAAKSGGQKGEALSGVVVEK